MNRIYYKGRGYFAGTNALLSYAWVEGELGYLQHIYPDFNSALRVCERLGLADDPNVVIEALVRNQQGMYRWQPVILTQTLPSKAPSMSHVFWSTNTRFTYNEDLSGDVEITVFHHDVPSRSFSVPGHDLLDFIAEYVRSIRMSRLQQMKADEVLGLL